MNELVENIILLAHKLEDENDKLFSTKDYLEALHDGRLDYTAEKETTAKTVYKTIEAKEKELIKELKELLKGGDI